MTGYYGRIMGILEPKVGFTLAQSVISAKCEKLGLEPAGITADSLPALAGELHEPLRIFGGEAFAKSLTDKIRALAP